MFSVGQKVFRNYPVTSSMEGVIGRTRLVHTVVGPSFDYKGVTWVPLARKDFGKVPFLVDASELYTEGKK